MSLLAFLHTAIRVVPPALLGGLAALLAGWSALPMTATPRILASATTASATKSLYLPLVINEAPDYPLAYSAGGDIYVMNADGSSKTNLTNTPDTRKDTLRWSPDAKKISYRSVTPDGLNKSDIYVSNANGSGTINLTGTPDASEFDLKWSPNGKRIVYVSARHDAIGNLDIFVVNADGSGTTNLTGTSDRFEFEPEWLPQASSITGTRP